MEVCRLNIARTALQLHDTYVHVIGDVLVSLKSFQLRFRLRSYVNYLRAPIRIRLIMLLSVPCILVGLFVCQYDY